MLQKNDQAGWLVERLADRKTREIAPIVGELIQTGQLPGGTRLPTVRTLAGALGISPGSVAAAWARLRDDGLIATHRRGGTVVTRPEPAADEGSANRLISTDLAYGVPDLSLQPNLGPALAAATQALGHAPSSREPIAANLRKAVAPTWPFEPEAWMTAGGGTEGTLLAIEAAAPRGSKVAIEEPTSPRILGTLERLGLTPIPVACDADGPLPDALAKALREKPSAFIFQPRAQVPLGYAVTRRRIGELAAVLRQDPSVAIVEDDHMGPVAGAPIESIGVLLPDRVIHVRAYCKAYGVELRTCVIAGARRLIERAQEARSHGLAATSRILQEALAFLIEDRSATTLLETARRLYASRRDNLARALKARGHETDNRDGVLLWLPVGDEASAIASLAKAGVTVGPGSRCYFTRAARDHVRIATSLLPDDKVQIERLADQIARALSGGAWEELD